MAIIMDLDIILVLVNGCGSINVFWNTLEDGSNVKGNINGNTSKAGFGILSGAGSFTARFNSFWSIC